MTSLVRSLAAATLAALALTAPAWAQTTSQVQFPRGSDHATLSGTLRGHEYRDYLLGARAGQTMTVTLSTRGSAYFNVLPPGSNDVPIYNSSTGPGGAARVKLPDDGQYRIRVYLMGNAKDADKAVGYRVTVKIAATAGSGAAGKGQPSLAEKGCLRDVARETQNRQVVILSSSFSQAGTEVIVGVGPQKARWRCIGYSDGKTGGIRSLTDEGRL